MLIYMYAAMSLIVSPFSSRTVEINYNRMLPRYIVTPGGNIDSMNNRYENSISMRAREIVSAMERERATKFYNIIKRNSQDKINEFLFLVNKKTKVYIHLDQLIPDTDIYHIGITFKTASSRVRYDMMGSEIWGLSVAITRGLRIKKELHSTTILWEYTDKTLDEVLKFEKNMKHKYILGVNDCRHYVRSMTTWACEKPTPIWSLDKLVHKMRDMEL